MVSLLCCNLIPIISSRTPRQLRQLEFDATVAVELPAQGAIDARERPVLVLMLARNPVELVTFRPEGDRGAEGERNSMITAGEGGAGA